MNRMKYLLLIILTASMLTAAGTASGDVRTNRYAFPIGERLTYGLYWGVIRVGTAETSIDWFTDEAGRHLLLGRAKAQTGPVVSRIFPVDNYLETIMDPETLLPLYYLQSINEGRKSRFDRYRFKHDEGVAVRTDRQGKTETVEIADDTRDLLSLTYAMRNRGFSVGQEEQFSVVVEEKVYDLFLTGEEIERVRVPGQGRQRSLRIQPVAKFGEIFQREGRMWLWFSLDPSHQCLRAEAKIPVAHVRAVLLDDE